ncbi:MAG: hypothetical protein ABIJ16_10980 [Bacteroidota bacterium]
MSFEFPAYHKETRKYAADRKQLYTIAEQTLNQLGRTAAKVSESVIRSSTSMGLASWGEDVEIITGDGEIIMKSSCTLPTQCIDRGKNKKNVRKFFSAFEQNLQL